MYTLTLEQGYSVWTMLAVAAAAILLVGLFYYRAFRMLRAHQWQLLLALRIVAILLVVLLLFRPVVSYQKELREKPTLVLAVDSSSSMSVADDSSGVSRFNQARTLVEQWCQQLQGDFNLKVMEFSDRAAVLEDVGQLAGRSPDGQATSLGRAIVAAADQLTPAQRKNGALILFSDGIHNSARSPLEVAGKLGVVIHTVGVGSSLRTNKSFCDVQVNGIICPDRLLLKNKARISGLVDAIGLAGRVVHVALEEDGHEIAESELTLDDTPGDQKVEFEFLPETKGRHTYTVRVPPLPEEKIVENNQRSAVANVIEPGIRVLYVEGTLRTEYGAIVDRFLAKDPDLEFCALVQTRPNVFLARKNLEGFDLKTIPSDEETINKFDVFILGDLDSSYFKPEQQALFVKRIRNGGGLIMLGGYHSLGPGGYAGSPIGQILPVDLGGREIGQVTEPFVPLLTPEGVRHPIFANIAAFFPTKGGAARESELLELDGCTRVAGPRPGASVLAVYPGGKGEMPILAVQPVEKGRTAVFCGDTTRKWHQGFRAADRESPFLRFWGQTVRWLAGRSTAVEARAAITGSTDKTAYEPEETIRLEATLRDEKGEGSSDGHVLARIRDPQGQTEQVPMLPILGPVGHYAGTYLPKTAGKYEVTIEGKVAQLTLETEKTAVEVGRKNLEFEKLDMDDRMLAKIAALSRGRYVHISAASALLDQLDRTVQEKHVTKEKPLFWPPGFWAAFVLVLTVEWTLRRRFQLR